MTRNDLADILASCLDSIERGERTLEECLVLYPEHRADLEVLLGTLVAIQERADFQPRPSFRMASRARLLRRLPPRQMEPGKRATLPAARKTRLIPGRLVVLWTSLLILAVSLLGGSTVYAAGGALPGDTLFPVKRLTEETRLWMSDDAEDVLLLAQFAQVRVVEIQALAEAHREEDLVLAVNLLGEDIAASTQSLASLAQENPERAAELSQLLEERFSIHADVLASRLDTVPEQARPAIEHAIRESNRGREIVEDLFEDERPGGGAPDEVPAADPAPTAVDLPDEEPDLVSTPPGNGNGPPDDSPGPPSTQPGGGPPDEDPPGNPTRQQPGGGPPDGTAGPPGGVPGNRP